jgi:hypothetical protein
MSVRSARTASITSLRTSARTPRVSRNTNSCGGGFVPRPIRPSKNSKGDNYLGKDPARTKVKHRPVDPAEHARFSAAIKTKGTVN